MNDLGKVTANLIKRGKHRGFLTMAEVQQELEEIEAPDPLPVPLRDITELHVAASAGHVCLDGRTQADLFPPLKLVLSEDFGHTRLGSYLSELRSRFPGPVVADMFCLMRLELELGIHVRTGTSYVFAGDMNGDGFSGNDLIYIPRDTSEMNFVPFTVGTRTFTAAEQTQAFEAYINQDPYLRDHRGKYAERGGLMLPIAKRIDLSITQEVFRNIGGRRNAGQFRIDFTNFGNLLNSSWGVGQRLVVPTTQANGAQLLTNPAVDAQGRASYRLAVVGGQLVTRSFETTTNIGSGTTPADVYNFMLSFRYSFN